MYVSLLAASLTGFEGLSHLTETVIPGVEDACSLLETSLKVYLIGMYAVEVEEICSLSAAPLDRSCRSIPSVEMVIRCLREGDACNMLVRRLIRCLI